MRTPQDSGDSPGNKSLLLGLAPLKSQSKGGNNRSETRLIATPQSSDASDQSDDDDVKRREAFKVIRIPRAGGEQGAGIPKEEDVFECESACEGDRGMGDVEAGNPDSPGTPQMPRLQGSFGLNGCRAVGTFLVIIGD